MIGRLERTYQSCIRPGNSGRVPCSGLLENISLNALRQGPRPVSSTLPCICSFPVSFNPIFLEQSSPLSLVYSQHPVSYQPHRHRYCLTPRCNHPRRFLRHICVTITPQIFIFNRSMPPRLGNDSLRALVDPTNMERRYRSIRTALHPGERPERETNYSCSSAALADLRNPNIGFSRHPQRPVAHIVAQERLEDFNDISCSLSPERREALRRIERLHALNAEKAWWADVIFKVILTPI